MKGGGVNNSNQSGKAQDKLFRVLSIDGGGVRGVFPAKILELMETKLCIQWPPAQKFLVLNLTYPQEFPPSLIVTVLAGVFHLSV